MTSAASRGVLAVLAAGAVLRVGLLAAPSIWFDEATSGITGLAVLRGELPVYFFGQPFMGTLGDAYLAAPLYVVFGVSIQSLELLSVLLSLAWLGLVVRLAWDGFGPRAALFTALVLAVPPDYLLYWAHEGRPHYPLAMVLGSLALLLALRAPVAPGRRSRLHFALLGGVLGLAFWTNLLSVVFVPAAGCLAVRYGLGPALRGALVAVPAFALGSLPHWLYAVPHGTAVPPAGGRIRAVELVAHLRWAAGRAWPTLSGVPSDLHGATSGMLLALALAAVYVIAALAAVRRLEPGRPAARALAVGLLVLAATNLAIAVGTQYGRFLESDPRYLLPLYTALPPLLGAWLARLAAWPATALTAALLVVHVAGGLAGQLPLLSPGGRAAARALHQPLLDTLATLEREGLRRLYAADFGTRVFTFLSAERVIFSGHYDEIYPGYVRAVDGAAEVAWWSGPSPAFEENLRALGVQATYRPLLPLGGVYTRFAVRAEPIREIDPRRLTVTASEAPATAAWTVDRDVTSLWRTARPKRGGEWIQVDLGAVEPVALLRLLPGTYQEVPTGLRLEASRDGQRWERLVELASYIGPLYWSAGRPMGRVRSGRIELRPPPTEARYLRLTQLGQHALWHWTVREIFVYVRAPGAPAPPSGADGTELAARVREAGVRRLLADHGWGSRVALADPAIRILPANLFLDAYGFSGSARDFWPPVRWAPGTGALLEPADAEGFAELARESGLAFTRRAVGGLALFAYATPPPRPGVPLGRAVLRITASRQAERAALAADGDPKTRWATAGPQAPGDWVRVDWDGVRSVRAVRLWTSHPTDSPRALALEGSEDGTTWRPIAAEPSLEGRLRWGGIALLRDGVEGVRLDFPPAPLRALRLTLTRGDPVFDWSIHELTVYGSAPAGSSP